MEIHVQTTKRSLRREKELEEVGGINAEAGQFPEGWVAPAADDSERPPRTENSQ